MEIRAQSVHAEQEALVLETSSGDEIGYLLYLSEAVGEREAWPLILYLHGSDGNGGDIELVRARSLPVWAAVEDLSQFIVVSPQLPSGSWDGLFERLDELLEHVSETLPVDEDAFFVTGYSIGGTGAWQYALHAPERFAAIVPVAGGPTSSTPEPVPDEICLLADLPILIYHEDEDTAVPIESNIANVEALSACGNDAVNLTTYRRYGGHNGTWQMAYADAELYEWMLAQVK